MSGLEEYKQMLEGKLLENIKVPLKFMPLWMEAIGAGVFISRTIEKNPKFKARLKEIDDKIFLFQATDINKGFYIHMKDGNMKIIPHMAKEPDVTMKGEVKVLIELLLNKADPDTIFFSRRLEITGDTAAAIHFKNILASLS